MSVNAATARRGARDQQVSANGQGQIKPGQHAEVAGTGAYVGIDGDALASVHRLHQHIATAVGAEGHAVGVSVAQRQAACRAAQHNGAVSTAGAHIGLGQVVQRGDSRCVADTIDTDSHAAHGQVVGFQHKNTATCSQGTERADCSFKVVVRGRDGGACVQAQAGSRDVQVGVVGGAAGQRVGVQNAACRGSDADRARGQGDVTHRHIGGRQQASRSSGACAQQDAAGVHGDGARARLQIYVAVARGCAGGAHVGVDRKAQGPCGQNAHISVGARNIGVDRDVSVHAQGLQKHVPGAVAAHSHAVCIGVAQRQAARRGAQHDGAVSSTGAQVRLAADLGATGARAAQAVDGDRHTVHHQGVGFQHKHTAAARSTREGGHGDFQRICRCPHATCRSGLHQETGGSDVHVSIAVGDGAARDQRHFACAF